MNSRFVLLLLLGVFAGPMFASVAYADYVVATAPVIIALPPPCLSCGKPCLHKHHPRKHRIMPSHRKHYRRHCAYVYGSAMPVCVYRYYPQAEIPAFRSGAGRGRYVNLYDCAPYDPDMSTGDDDPTIYPGMNINN